ncbi:hypothetical protein [Wolbachia pipientis]|nr:hypothetical protein [Wolbachia pipientis]
MPNNEKSSNFINNLDKQGLRQMLKIRSNRLDSSTKLSSTNLSR